MKQGASIPYGHHLEVNQCGVGLAADCPYVAGRRTQKVSSMLLSGKMLLKLATPLVLLLLMEPATALQLKRVRTDLGFVLRLRGDVRTGDFRRLETSLQDASLVGLEIKSGGGSLEEGLDIARVVRDKALVVYASRECDSACALIFFAAKERFIGRRCRIGVHSVSNERGKEDGDSVRTTVKMSRLLVGLGVPPAVIGKLVATPPAKITYLDNRDLVELNVRRTNPFRKIYDLASLIRNDETRALCSPATDVPGEAAADARQRSCVTASARASEER